MLSDHLADNSTGPLFEGRFSDGTSAAASDVPVRLTTRGIEISRPGNPVPIVWPYGALHAAEPLTVYSIDALLSYEHMPGASLFVPEGTFARRLAIEAPHLTAKAQRWRHATPWLGAAAAVVLIGLLIWLAELSPARAIARMLPESARELLGKNTVASMSEGHKTCTSPEGSAALEELVKRLSNASGSSQKFKAVVVDWGLMNAFAAPGEQILITQGILAKAEGPDEIAGVLAHEMGHGIEMHPETGIVRAIGLSAAIDLMLGGSGGTLANMGALLAQLSYNRDAERQADGHALRLLRGAGISAKGLLAFFKRMQTMEDKVPGAKAISDINILSTHPATEERRTSIERQSEYPATPALPAKSWNALKNICKPAAEEPSKQI